MDNPRQNIEICVITEGGVKPLAADELDRIVTAIEKDMAEEEANK